MAYCGEDAMEQKGLPKLSRKVLVLLIFFAAGDTALYGQGPCGGKPCPVVRIGESNAPRKVNRPRQPRPVTTGSNAPKPHSNPPPSCEDSDLVVVCGMPGCEITIDGKNRNVTDDLGGITFQVAGNRPYKVKVTKAGYE